MSEHEITAAEVVDRVRHAEHLAGHPTGQERHGLKRRIGIQFASWMRWLHIYLSMFSLAVLLFFAVTGITLNHPDWFYGEADSTRQAKGQVTPKWIQGSGEAVDKLEVVEHLRKAHGIRGALAEFKVDEQECMVSFKGPGYSADAFIDRASGQYDLSESYHGFVAVINDLHKGRDTGKVWSVVIDVSAVLMTVVSLTGLTLLFYLKRRRMPGLLVVVMGTLAVAVIVRLWVP